MKYGLVGLGLVALASLLAGCSGTASTAPPRNDAGPQADAGDASSDAGSLGEAGSASDAGNRSDASAVDSGTGDASQGEAGASGDSDAGSPPQICNPGELSCDGAVARAACHRRKAVIRPGIERGACVAENDFVWLSGAERVAVGQRSAGQLDEVVVPGDRERERSPRIVRFVERLGWRHAGRAG